ncbi:alpha-hydroxy acid oxidase [Nocardia brasiliensis]|uniref:Dehydrogenase n=1 Tax=Nocardia brasiliensis (strain ATCC 700358 / HUJEG-1) TaxID=1133849 RepID=K0ER89_NOCB7|nr:alpha-hydroxy acid oxidase [Nocardia brasiliensis]AFU00077.1 dehydrogenase [Nocardia brasiliensis ATCC 700358]OCF86270.1 2-hydroxy-acid oxidase [Nocardia brasiliensis]
MTCPPATLEQRAKELLEPAHYDFFAGGAGEEIALADNEQAFRRLALLPRVLRDTSGRSIATTLLGDPSAMPVFVSPTAFHRLAHPEGERATARAVAAAGLVLIASMAATVAIGEITAAAREIDRNARVWFQLYLQPEPDVTTELVRRAERAGCTALVVTVDSPVFGRRTRDDRNDFHDLPAGLCAENMRGLPGTAGDGPRPIAMSPTFTWDHLEWLREVTALPLVLKGIMHPEDARLAIEFGADAILVSNHGGRQLDAAPATLDALPAIAAGVAGRIPILLDGGVRRGSDVVLALALGATAVGLGRPVLWGLTVGGDKGVAEVLDTLRTEVEQTLTLCGVAALSELDTDLVTVRGTAARC